MTQRRGHARLAAALWLAVVVAGCDATVTPTPTVPASSQAAQGSAGPGQSSGPGDTSGPFRTAGPGEQPVDDPLPPPTLTEAGLVGQELYNPAGVANAVVSLLDLMSVEVRSDVGAVLRPGSDRGAGLISLTETEVRGLIEMTRADLEAADDQGGGPITVGQLYAGLQATFPSDFTVDDFAAAYDAAYAADPAGLVSAALLGMPITPGTRLLRIQVWLLLIDGFPDGEAAGTGSATAAAVRFTVPVRSKPVALVPAGGLGAAGANLPGSTSPVPGWSNAEWHAVLRKLPILAYNVSFAASGATNVHEGHGRLGDRWQLTASLGQGGDLFNRLTGVALLSGTQVGAGLPLTWNSTRPGTLTDHGQVSRPLHVAVPTDANGAADIAYQAKREDSDGKGQQVTVDGNLYAEVDQLALARAAYRIPAPLDAILDCRCLISGIRRTPHPDFGIAWHEQDILDITIENYYDFKVPVPLPDELFALSRKGKDKVSGTLARNKDGTYSGIMHASSGGTANGMAFLGLAGVAECSTPDVASADQDLFVVGEKVGLVSLLLRFYPASTPVGTFTNCQAKIEFAGDPKAGQPAGYYLPLNDTRWQQPAIGIEIPIPSFIGNVIDQYEDRYLYQLENDLCSVFYITVIWPDPKAARAPTAGPPRTTHLCQ